MPLQASPRRLPRPGLAAALLCLAGLLALPARAAEGSALIGKPAPAFALARLDQPAERAGPALMKGRVWLLNVWASWCTGCRQEHPLLMALARSGEVPVVGLAHADTRDAARQCLEAHGDPYLWSVLDADGRIGGDYQVYGLPETYVIDRQGVVRFKHRGPLTAELLRDRILPLVRSLDRGRPLPAGARRAVSRAGAG
jgi:cytochrome c biogenesis protein CcmG/thiol:disulfide interchange protein DsbE